MAKVLLIIGAGPGLSMAAAKKFGREGFTVGMISRSEQKLKSYVKQLSAAGVKSDYAAADAGDTTSLKSAIKTIREKLGLVDVLLYNAVDARLKHIMDESAEDLTNGFQISVAGALTAVQQLHADLKQNKGAVLFTGGGTALYPVPEMGTISLGKAGLRSLAHQLHKALKEDGIYAGTLTITGMIDPASDKHSPDILAEKFYGLYKKRAEAEMKQ